MSIFNEDDLHKLYELVEMEIYNTTSSHLMELEPKYYPFLQNLQHKLEKYYDKHYGGGE